MTINQMKPNGRRKNSFKPFAPSESPRESDLPSMKDAFEMVRKSASVLRAENPLTAIIFEERGIFGVVWFENGIGRCKCLKWDSMKEQDASLTATSKRSDLDRTGWVRVPLSANG